MDKKTGILIGCFLVLNLFQAALTQLTGDEALYWMYSNHLDFGFRDHPPLIGIIIGIGYFFFQNELGARLGVAFANAAMLWALYKLVKPQQFWPFALLILSVPVISLYGFIATPDVPLMLFTALYFLVWKQFVKVQDKKNTVLLGVCMALLMWSKYQGIFIILFTFLPHKFLWRSKQYWMAAGLGILLFSPHLIWQATHDFVTVDFHLNGRNNDAWELKHLVGYAAGQLGVFNPIVFLLTIIICVRTKATHPFEKSMRWVLFTTLILFFINSFRGRVEPHWTAPLTLSAIYIICNYWQANKPSRALLGGLCSIAVLLLVARVFMVADVLPQLHRDFHRNRPKMQALHKLAGPMPVCFMNSYQNPSLYMFYTAGKAHSINNIDGGKNQYDYWEYGKFCHNQPFLFVASYPISQFEEHSADNFTFTTKVYNNLPIVGQLFLKMDHTKWSVEGGESVVEEGWLINKNNYPIELDFQEQNIVWSAEFNHKKTNEAKATVTIRNHPRVLQAGDSAKVKVGYDVPFLTGKNRMCLAASTQGLPATYQSNWVQVEVNK